MRTRKMAADPGITFVMKEYQKIMRIVLEEREQTQAEAAQMLGISVSTFQKIYRCSYLPNFRTSRGKVLAQRFKRWSGLKIDDLFPQAFFTKDFFERPKTHIVSLPFQLVMRREGKEIPMISFPTSPEPSNPPTPTKRKRKKRKARKA